MLYTIQLSLLKVFVFTTCRPIIIIIVYYATQAADGLQTQKLKKYYQRW